MPKSLVIRKRKRHSPKTDQSDHYLDRSRSPGQSQDGEGEVKGEEGDAEEEEEEEEEEGDEEESSEASYRLKYRFVKKLAKTMIYVSYSVVSMYMYMYVTYR